MQDWEKMVDFSDKLIHHAFVMSRIINIFRSSPNIDELRISIVLLDQATELLMKAYLLRNGYSIQKINYVKFNKGIKESDKIKEILDDDKTIDFPIVLSLVKKSLPQIDSNGMKNFHELRNEIYHRSLEIDVNKENEIKKFVPILKSFYKLAFLERDFPHPDDTLELLRERYR